MPATKQRDSALTTRCFGSYLLSTLLIATTLFALSACSRLQYQQAGPKVGEAALHAKHILTADGYQLPLRQWQPENTPVAVILGLHGFGDYSNSFSALKAALVEAGDISIYAYDQRGFGETKNPGIWAGTETLVRDALAALTLLRQRYPNIPLYLVGDSMGGAVALLAASEAANTVDGILLIAPAVWAADTMPWYQRFALWLAMRVAPGARFSGDTPARFGIRPTDDREVMRAMSEDPLMQRQARVDTLQGLTDLMGDAARVDTIPIPTLILYGLNDQIIPLRATCEWFEHVLAKKQKPELLRVVLYPDGYHMLTRYSGSEAVHSDIATWLQETTAALPSGHERNAAEIANVCDVRL